MAGNDALSAAHDLARYEGILAGTTAGATLAGAIAVARRAPQGSRILCMLPDTGERYLSTPLFADIPVEMTEEERVISRSTPTARFDVPSGGSAKPAVVAEQPAVSPEAAAFIRAAVSDATTPVVMFALEWCEFCCSVRKMFKHHGIPYRSIDLDSAAFQKEDWGGKIRAALGAETGIRTIPQIFVAGQHIGGCTDLFDGWRSGDIQQRMDAAGVAFRQDTTDPYGFLPGWLHARG